MDALRDVGIVGAGPAGLAAAVYTGRARRSTLILEKGLVGGQILVTDSVENYPGFPDGVTPVELMRRLQEHAEKFGAGIESDEVLAIEKSQGGWRLKGAKSAYEARAVIIASGSSYRALGLPDEARLTGRGVSYCATCDGAFYSGQDIVVVGGGDNALKEALFLTRYCRSVTIVHRRHILRGEKIYQERVLANAKIRMLWNTVVESVNGGDKLESVTLRDLETGRSRVQPLAGLFVSIGTEPRAGFVRGLLEVDERGRIKVKPGMETSAPGIFAAGDVCDACARQIATAVGTGVQAALSTEEFLSGA